MTPGQVLLPAALAGAAVLVLGALPSYGSARLAALRPAVRGAPGGGGPARDGATLRRGGPAGGGDWLSGRAAAGALLCVAGLVGALVGGPALAVLAPAGVLALRRAVSSRRQRTMQQRERLRAGEACMALAGELRAGRAAADALEAAARLAEGPTRRVLLAGAAAGRLGGDVGAALAAGAGESAAPEVLRGLSACWRVCSQAGSGLAAAVDRLAEGVVARQEQDRAVETALAGPRATALVLTVLPLGGVGLAALLGARPWEVLFGTPAGMVCLLVGCALDALGLWWTNRLVAGARALP